MKGLLKYNFSAVYTNAKVFSLFMLAFGIFAVAFISPDLQMYFVLIGIVGFSLNASVVLNQEHGSRWGKYKLVLPVKRTDIVKSLFLNYILWLFVGIFFAGAETCAACFLHKYPPEQCIGILEIFVPGISISLLMDAIFIPLFYWGGEEKSTVYLQLSLLCAFGSIALLSNVFDASLLLRIITMLGCSLTAFALSYPLTVAIFRKKEY